MLPTLPLCCHCCRYLQLVPVLLVSACSDYSKTSGFRTAGWLSAGMRRSRPTSKSTMRRCGAGGRPAGSVARRRAGRPQQERQQQGRTAGTRTPTSGHAMPSRVDLPACLQGSTSLRTAILVNCGAAEDVRELLHLEQRANVRVIIVDSHRCGPAPRPLPSWLAGGGDAAAFCRRLLQLLAMPAPGANCLLQPSCLLTLPCVACLAHSCSAQHACGTFKPCPLAAACLWPAHRLPMATAAVPCRQLGAPTGRVAVARLQAHLPLEQPGQRGRQRNCIS